jgi:predicted extracellular nuclease
MRKLLPLSSVALVCAALLTTPALAATNIGDLHCNDANGVALTLNSVVTIQGIVTANQPTGSANRFYLQDATAASTCSAARRTAPSPSETSSR